jgi:hypothetical protein
MCGHHTCDGAHQNTSRELRISSVPPPAHHAEQRIAGITAHKRKGLSETTRQLAACFEDFPDTHLQRLRHRAARDLDLKGAIQVHPQFK